MVEREPGQDGARSEFDALMVTRGLIVFGLAAFAVAGTSAAVIVEAPSLTIGMSLTLIVALLLLAMGFALRGRPVGVWLALAVLTLPIGMWIAQGYPSDAWIPIGIAYFEIVLLLIVMAGRRTGLIIAAVSVVLVGLGSLSSPLSVEIGGSRFWVGWIIVPQLAVATVWLWWAWWDLVRSAERIDADLMRRRVDLDQVQVDRERVRVWRRAASRTHETVLNDLRYVLRSRVLDRERLRAHLESSRVQDLESDIPVDLAALVRSVIDDASLTIPMRTARLQGGAVLDAERWRLVRSAVIEIIRNAERHGHARQVTLSTWTVGRTWIVMIEHDAREPESDSAPGIGRSIVLDGALADVDIDVRFSAGRATLTGEVNRAATDEPEPVAREGSRAILSSVMAATSVGGLLYWGVPLLTGGGSNLLLALIGVLTSIAAGVVSLRSHPLANSLVLILGLVCGLVPWLVATSTGPCLDLGMTVSVVFLSGYSLVAVLLWARHQWTWVIAAFWVAGLTMLVNGGLTSCAAPTLALATSGVLIIPAYLVVAAISRATATERWRRTRATREEQVIARARAQAEADLALQLERRVDQARELLLDIADGREIDVPMGERLRCLDAGIRAAIQVDPVTAGAFSLTARDLAIAASDQGIPVVVRALRDSSDARPVPPEVMTILKRILMGSASPTLQVMTDGRMDYLTVQTVASATVGTGLALDAVLDVHDLHVEVMVVEEDHESAIAADTECLIMVTRPVVADGLSAAEPALLRE